MADDPIKEDPVEKFRKLIASFIPLARLPRKGGSAEKESSIETKKEEVDMAEGKNVTTALPQKGADKNDKLAALPKKSGQVKSVEASKPASPTPSFSLKSSGSKKDKPVGQTGNHSAVAAGYPLWGPRLWTTASTISLTVNILMTIVLIILVVSVYRLKLNVAQIMKVGTSLTGLPGGLYSNFEKMERANIQTNVVVNTNIPVRFDLPLNQQTNVVLAQDVTITNALVTVNTGGLNITRAPTTIVLPQGTVLPVNLSLIVPVDQGLPITLNVPVNIPLKDTQLNEPFIGLQEVIKPLYCFLDANALDLDNQPICQ